MLSMSFQFINSHFSSQLFSMITAVAPRPARPGYVGQSWTCYGPQHYWQAPVGRCSRQQAKKSQDHGSKMVFVDAAKIETWLFNMKYDEISRHIMIYMCPWYSQFFIEKTSLKFVYQIIINYIILIYFICFNDVFLANLIVNLLIFTCGR